MNKIEVKFFPLFPYLFLFPLQIATQIFDTSIASRWLNSSSRWMVLMLILRTIGVVVRPVALADGDSKDNGDKVCIAAKDSEIDDGRYFQA